MDKKNELTPEQKKRLEEMDAILADKENQEKIMSMKTADEVFAFFEEKGYAYTDGEKDIILREAKRAEEEYNRELSDDELEKAAGGWNVFASIAGGLFGSGAGAGAAFLGFMIVGSNPIGWVVGGCAAVGAVGCAIAFGTETLKIES